MPPRELLPGLFHWTASHPKIRIEVSSYWIEAPRVLLDPLLPPDGIDWLRAQGPPEHVVLTNRHHWRHCSELIAAFDCPVWCNALGLHEAEGEPGGERVRGFRAGELLPGGIETFEVGVLCPDETALRIPLAGAAACLAVADGVVRIGAQGRGNGPLGFVPDALIADSPEQVAAVKDGLRAAYRRLCALDWETLLLAHGLPLVGDGRPQLRAFAGGSGLGRRAMSALGSWLLAANLLAQLALLAGALWCIAFPARRRDWWPRARTGSPATRSTSAMPCSSPEWWSWRTPTWWRSPIC